MARLPKSYGGQADPCSLPADEAVVSRGILSRLSASERLYSWDVHHTALRWLLARGLIHVTPGCLLVLCL